MILTAFLVGLTLALVGAFVLVVRGVALWKQGKRTGGALTSELALFEERSARTEQLLAAAERASQDLLDATERLRVSRAKLQVLLGEIEGAQRRTRWLRAQLVGCETTARGGRDGRGIVERVPLEQTIRELRLPSGFAATRLSPPLDAGAFGL